MRGEGDSTVTGRQGACRGEEGKGEGEGMVLQGGGGTYTPRFDISCETGP